MEPPEHVPGSPEPPAFHPGLRPCQFPDGHDLPDVPPIDEAGPDGLFVEDGLPLVELRLPRGAWDQMCENAKDYADWMEARRDADPSPSTFQHASVRADLQFQGRMLLDVAVRFRGQANVYIVFYDRWNRPRPGALEACKADRMRKKPSYRIDVAEYVPGRTLGGEEVLNLLGREGSDASYLRELGAQHVAAGFGLPAARTSHARLCRGGRYDGLYTLAEDADSPRFLRQAFPDASGGDYWEVQGGGAQVWQEGWTATAGWNEVYEPVDGTPTSDPGAIGTLLDMGSAIAAGEDPGDLGAVVDIDGWLRNIALDMVIPDYDGMWGNHKNHLIYDHPDRGLLLVGYDKDLAFVGLGSYFYGRCEGSIWGAHPCWSRRRAPPAVAGELLRREPERYVELVEELLAGAFDPDALIAWLQARRDAIRPWVTADRYYQPLGPACDRDPTWCQWYTPGAWEWDAGPALETDIRTRWDQVRAQLDGDFPCAESCDEGPHAGLDDGDD